MAQQSIEGARRAVLGRATDWIKRFDVDDYVDNPPLIEKLYEEKQLTLGEAMEFKGQLEAAQGKLHQLQLENQTLRHGLVEASRRSSFMFALSLVAMLLLGLGINVASQQPGDRLGWVLIGLGCVVEVVAFFLKPRVRNG